jgi:hypothetical protein
MRSTRFWLLVVIVAGACPHLAGADVTSSSNPALVDQGVVFTVQLKLPSDVSATPTGSVTFVDGGVSIGTVPLQNGVATFATQFATPGDHSIVAEYSGDQNFQPANSLPFIERITADDVFTISAAPSVVTQQPGGSSAVRLTVFGNGSAGASTHLSCEMLPPGTVCSFQANAVTPSLAGSNATLTIASSATRTAMKQVTLRGSYNAALLLPFLLGSVVTMSMAHCRKRVLLLVGLLVLGTVTICLTGCGDTLRVVPGGTPAGSYTIRIVGNDGTFTQTASIQLNIK